MDSGQDDDVEAHLRRADEQALEDAVSALTEADTDSVDRVANSFESTLAAEDADVRTRSAIALSTISDKRPDLVDAVASPLLDALADSDDRVRTHAASALANAGILNTEDVSTALDRLPSVTSIDDDAGRAGVLELFDAMADVEPEAVAERVADLEALTRLDRVDVTVERSPHERGPQSQRTQSMLRAARRRERLRLDAALLLTTLAKRAPTAVAAQIEHLPEVITDEENAQVRAALVHTVGYIALEDPTAVTDAFSAVVDAFGEATLLNGRATAAWTLATFTAVDSTRVATVVRENTEVVTSLLHADDPAVRQTAAELVAGLRDHPDAVFPFVDTLLEGCVDDHEDVRTAAASALAAVDDETLRSRLTHVVGEDDAARVRRAVDQAAE